MLKIQRQRKLNNHSLRQLFFARLILFCAGLLITMSQHSVLAEEINSACLADDEILHKQQGEPESRVVESKLKLLYKIVYDSATAKRIENSENDKANALLDSARESLADSIILFDEDCITKTEQKLNDGLKLAQTASRYVVNYQRVEEISRQRDEYLSERIATYREAYNQIYIDKDNEKDNMFDGNRLQNLINSAAKLAQKDDYKQALTMLDKGNISLIRTLSSTGFGQ